MSKTRSQQSAQKPVDPVSPARIRKYAKRVCDGLVDDGLPKIKHTRMLDLLTMAIHKIPYRELEATYKHENAFKPTTENEHHPILLAVKDTENWEPGLNGAEGILSCRNNQQFPSMQALLQMTDGEYDNRIAAVFPEGLQNAVDVTFFNGSVFERSPGVFVGQVYCALNILPASTPMSVNDFSRALKSLDLNHLGPDVSVDAPIYGSTLSFDLMIDVVLRSEDLIKRGQVIMQAIKSTLASALTLLSVTKEDEYADTLEDAEDNEVFALCLSAVWELRDYLCRNGGEAELFLCARDRIHFARPEHGEDEQYAALYHKLQDVYVNNGTVVGVNVVTQEKFIVDWGGDYLFDLCEADFLELEPDFQFKVNLSRALNEFKTISIDEVDQDGVAQHAEKMQPPQQGLLDKLVQGVKSLSLNPFQKKPVSSGVAATGHWDGTLRLFDQVNGYGEGARIIGNVDLTGLTQQQHALLKNAWIEENDGHLKSVEDGMYLLCLHVVSTPGAEQSEKVYFGLFEKYNPSSVVNEDSSVIDFSGFDGAQWGLYEPTSQALNLDLVSVQIGYAMEKHVAEIQRILGELQN